MSDEPNAGAPPEGEALPGASVPPPLPSTLQAIEQHAPSVEHRVLAAIEAWYAKHFHAAAVAGRTPLSADDKAALLTHVAEAVAPAAKE